MALKIEDIRLITGSDLVLFPSLENPEPEMVPLVQNEDISVFNNVPSKPKYLKDFQYEEIGEGSFIFNADCYEVIKSLPDNSISAVLVDPPYEILGNFQSWDAQVPSVKIWNEVYRVLKPGSHILSFGATRTYHKMTSNIEDAGFIIKDTISWIYGSGFPKSHKVGSEILETENGELQNFNFGTALKPAVELITLGFKPVDQLNNIENFDKWGTGGLNIDAARIPIIDKESYEANMNGNQRTLKPEGAKLGVLNGGWKVDKSQKEAPQGRWPANVIFDQEAGKMLDQMANKKGKMDFVGPSRFFYCPKPSSKEKELGLEGFEKTSWRTESGGSRDINARCGKCGKKFIGDPKYICNCDNPVTDNMVFSLKNNHATVKPIELLKYLLNLIVGKKEDALVLDMYFGSGSLGVSAAELGIPFVGIEIDDHYYKIAIARCKAAVERSKNKTKE